MTVNALPDGLLVAYYGDDRLDLRHGGDDLAGLPTVLFLDMPTDAQVARFAGYRSIGIAGVARSQTPPGWMTICRRSSTSWRLGAPIAHYKVCSTLIGAPHVGSIGRAIDLAVPILGGAWCPLVTAAPAIARYQAFGNLCRGWRRGLPDRPASDHVAPSGDADG